MRGRLRESELVGTPHYVMLGRIKIVLISATPRPRPPACPAGSRRAGINQRDKPAHRGLDSEVPAFGAPTTCYGPHPAKV
jgi:hypothetical protein